ncbi:MAG: 4Fe-4S binding protein [Lachnospiraceae bacterium]|nr:4Fe-4S binding protein [Lachnospiraceae bacterium]
MVIRMICEKKYCSGCGLCKSQCPVDAIKMEPDEEGFIYPVINHEVCMQCGLCEKLCPAVQCDWDHTIFFEEKEEVKIYSGYFLDEQCLMRSSAGGAAYAISGKIIESGGTVFGVRYADDYKSVYFDMAKDMISLSKFNESKYVESNRENLYKFLPEELSAGKKVLVIGLPCDIAAVRALVGEPSNLYTCKLVCRSNTSNKALKEFIRNHEIHARSALKKMSLRYKRKGRPTLPTRYRMEFMDGTIHEEDFVKSDFGKAFQILARPSCLNCYAKHMDHLADITLGDFQGITADHPLYKVNGVSLVCSHSRKGDELLENLEQFSLKEVEKETAWKYNWMIYSPIPKSLFRDEFSERFVKSGLRETCSAFCEEQNKILDKVMKEHIDSQKRTAIWGAGDTAEYLYERLEMEKWNITHIFDGSKMKIGVNFKGSTVENIEILKKCADEIDSLIVMIPSEDEQALNQFLWKLGWRGEIIHIGKYKFYREETW